jgi:hypothetical protein
MDSTGWLWAGSAESVRHHRFDGDVPLAGELPTPASRTGQTNLEAPGHSVLGPNIRNPSEPDHPNTFWPPGFLTGIGAVSIE